MFALLLSVAVAQPPAPPSLPPTLAKFNVTDGKLTREVVTHVPVTVAKTVTAQEVVNGQTVTVQRLVHETQFQTLTKMELLPEKATFATAGGTTLTAAEATAALAKQPVGVVAAGPVDKLFLVPLKPDTVVVTVPPPTPGAVPAVSVGPKD